MPRNSLSAPLSTRTLPNQESMTAESKNQPEPNDKIKVAGIELNKLSLAQLILLEETGNPLYKAMLKGDNSTKKELELSLRDSAGMIFIFACTVKADQALRRGRQEFERACFAWVTKNLRLDMMKPIADGIRDICQEYSGSRG